jgi:hypothetical protein
MIIPLISPNVEYNIIPESLNSFSFEDNYNISNIPGIFDKRGGGNTMVEGLLMIIIGAFVYIWAQNAAPLAGIAKDVCNSSVGQLGQSLLGSNAPETCNKVNANAAIIDKGPLFSGALTLIGFLLIITGGIQGLRTRHSRIPT